MGKIKIAILGLLMCTPLIAGEWRYVSAGSPLPKSELTLAEVIDIFTDYSLEHQSKIVGGEYAGLIEPWEKKIYISDRFELSIRRQSVIHELLHAHYIRRFNIATGGYPEGEAAIEAEATRIYEELFTPGRLSPSEITAAPIDPASIGVLQ